MHEIETRDQTVSSVDVVPSRLQSFRCMLPASIHAFTSSHSVFLISFVLLILDIILSGAHCNPHLNQVPTLGLARCSVIIARPERRRFVTSTKPSLLQLDICH
ncbi:hypothetical protein N7468_006489 [Penicillium chermesinum]|uniref:Uncharacterized protein n=1 Tax=Penicillium chermesinum TaxID=63820 RepID=A0A9W9NV53_9EURO|nr:uncharacterized protein N7468_006489 [Penicillium chermesinum]KAJ5225264.1 hypothetical protein N7468_006489 [Penicillium chermesinum]